MHLVANQEKRDHYPSPAPIIGNVMNTVFGILPFFVRKSEDNWGRAKGAVVYMPEGVGEDTALFAHEVFHVKQFYALVVAMLSLVGASFFISPWFISGCLALGLISRTTKFQERKEISAYGESVRFLVDKYTANAKVHIDHYAMVFDTSDGKYKEHLTLEEIKDGISKRYEDGRLF